MAFRKDVTTTIAARVFQLAINFLCSILLARFLKPEGLGVFTTLIALPTILISLGELGVRQSSAYFVGKNIFKVQQVTGALATVWIIVSILFGLIVIISYAFQDVLTEYPVASLMGATFIAAALVTRFANGIAIGNRWITRMNFGQGLEATVRLVVLTIFVVILRTGVPGALAAHTAAILAPGVLMIAWIRRDRNIRIVPNWDLQVIRRLLTYGFRFALALFVLAVNYRVNILILQNYVSDSEVGQFSLGIRIAELIWIPAMAMGAVVFSHSTTTENTRAFSLSAIRASRLAFLVCAVGAILLAILLPLLIPWIFGAEYATSIPVIRILLPGVVAAVFFKVLGPDLSGRGKPLIMMWASVTALVLNVVLNFVLIPRFGISGSAFASTCSYIAGAIIFVFIYAHATQISIREMAYKKDDLLALGEIIFLVKKRCSTGTGA